MKKFLLTILLLIVLIGGGLGFFIIRSFNAENFQKQVVQGVSEQTGRTLTIQGKTTVSWFPIPTIVLNNVSLSNQPGSPREVMMQAQQVSIQIDWQSMLSSPLEIKQVDIEKPVLYLEKLSNGARNWAFPFFQNREISPSGNLMTGSGPQMKINVMRLKDGSIEFLDNTRDFGFIAHKVSGNLKIDTVNGPYTFAGTGELNEETFAFSAKLDKYLLGSPTKFMADINNTVSGFQLNLDGLLTPENLDSDLTANSTFSVKKPNALLKVFGQQLPDPKLDVPTDGSFGIELRPNEDILKSFVIRFGNTENAPTVTGDLTRVRGKEKLSYSGAVAVNTLDTGVAQSIWRLLQINPFDTQTVPDVKLVLNAEKIGTGDKAISDFNAEIESRNGQITVTDLHAVLAGNTVIDGSIKSITVDEKTGYEMPIKMTSDNARALLSLVSDDKNLPPDDTVQKATLDGTLRLFADTYQADIDTAQVDHVTVQGTLAFDRGEKRPTVTLNLTAANLNTDTYFAYKPAEKQEDFAQTISNIQSYFQNNKALTAFDSVFAFDLTDVTFRSLPIARLLAKGTLSDGVLTVTTLEADDVATAQIRMNGTVSGIGTEEMRVDAGQLAFTTDRLQLFLERANIHPAFQFVESVSGVSFKTEGTLADKTWDIATQGRIGDLSGRFTGKITPASGQTVYRDFSFDVAHPDFQQLMKNVLPDTTFNKGLNGSFKLKGILNGTAQDFQISDGALSVGTQHISGQATFKKESGYSLTANLKAASFDGQKMVPAVFKQVFLLNPQSTEPFDFSTLDNWQIDLTLATEQLLYGTADLKKTNLNLTVKDKVLTLSDLSGQLRDNETAPFKATATISWADVPTVKAAIDLTNVPLKPDFLMIENRAFGNGTVTLHADVSGAGKTPAEVTQSLQGDGKFVFDRTQFVGAELDTLPTLVQTGLQKRLDDVAFKTQMTRALTTGRTSFPPISGTFTITDGIVRSVDAQLAAPAFVSDPIQITWGLPAQTLDIFMPVSLPHYPSLPPFALTAKGTVGQMAYQENATDLAAAVNAEVSAVVDKERSQQLQAEAVQKEQAQLDRHTRMRQAIDAANEAVQNATDKIYGDTDSEAAYLLQNAKDALQLVNELAIKENPTDAQYIQLMEQSRLAVLRAGEAVTEMQKDAYFDERNQLLVYQQRGREIVKYIEALHEERPDIELVERLLPAVTATQAKLETVAKAALRDITPEENERLSTQAETLFGQLQRAYEYVQRFQVTEPVVPVTEDVPVPSAAVKGWISR